MGDDTSTPPHPQPGLLTPSPLPPSLSPPVDTPSAVLVQAMSNREAGGALMGDTNKSHTERSRSIRHTWSVSARKNKRWFDVLLGRGPRQGL